MTKREEQIITLRNKGLAPSQIWQRTKGISRQKIDATLAKYPVTLPERKTESKTPKAITKCNGKDECLCVLCEARRWKLKHHGRDEFGTGGGRSEANSDRRVIRHAIGRI